MVKDKKIIDNIFKQARKDLYYPPILKVELADVKTSKIDLLSRSRSILIGNDMTGRLSPEALLGVFHHELNHWAKHPYDAKTLILEDHFLGKIANKDAIRNFYDDIVVNLDLIINKGLSEVALVYRELPALMDIERLLRAFYQEVTGIDFGEVRIEPPLKERLTELSKIDFLNTSRMRLKSNIRKFTEIVYDLFEEEFFLPFSLFSVRDFSPDEIRRAIRDLSNELEPQEYRDIVRNLMGRLKEAGISPGRKFQLQDLDRPDILWYKNRSKKYVVYIKVLSKKGSLYPNELKDFELDEGMDTFSPIESYGKVLPGLAKRYQLEEFEGQGEPSIPNVVIMLDSSGSMRHPDNEVSYAVLGAFSIARNYFEHHSRVGVINFSDINIELEPTSDRERVFRMLKAYQGGGTTLHLDQLKRYIANVTNGLKEMDYILITDAGIENIVEVADYLSELKGRVTIIWIKGDVKGHDRFERGNKLLKERLPSSVTFVEIEDEEEIPRIAVGKSFRVYEEY